MIELLAPDTDAAITEIGGKASGLVRLLAAGLDVPEAWVIPVSVSLDPTEQSVCLDAELPTWWEQVSARYPDSLWAVRSSAVAEDLEGASFAGVYETKLAIGSFDALRAAVTECWNAVTHDRATAYLDNREGLEAGGIALVLQRMIRPDAAGVMLTENPLKPFADEIVIDAAYGLGEAVVSGATHPDHIVLSRESGDVLQEIVGAKEVRCTWGTDEVVQQETTPAERAQRCLSDVDLKSLHAVAGQVTERIGARRDLEWAIENGRLFVVQDRPITGLPSRTPETVWSRRFGDEYLSEYTSPLGADLMLPWITNQQMDEVAAFEKRPEFHEFTKLRRHDGYIYINGRYAEELIKAVPLSSRQGPPVTWFSGSFGEHVRAVKFEPAMLLRKLRGPSKDKGRGPLKDNLKALERHCATIDASILPKLAQDYPALSAGELKEQIEEIHALGREHFRVIRWGMAHHGPILHGLLQLLLEKWGGDTDGSAYQTIISGVPGTRTAEINVELHELGLTVRRDPALLAQLRNDTAYAVTRAQTADSPFWVGFDAFLTRHGHRCTTREVSAPRWHQEPELVLGLVAAQVQGEAELASPAVLEASATARRVAAEETVMKAAGSRVKRRWLRKVIDNVHELTVYRENQRYHLDYLLAHMHLLLLEQGRRLTERGALPAPDDVFLLTGERFRALLDTEGPVDDPALREEIEAARAHRERHSRILPPTFIYDDVPTEGDGEDETQFEAIEGALVGFGASSGIASGVTRVVESASDLAKVREGDILVASNIDPGWTSVFPLLAGLVTQTGGILSHGAILAREYGTPTVTGVVGALTELPSGTQVEVNGSRGTVVISDAVALAETVHDAA